MLPIGRVSFAGARSMFNARRVLVSVWVAGSVTAGAFVVTGEAQQRPAGPSGATAPHSALVSRYCVSCHNARVKRGELALDGIVAQDVAQHPDVWEKVVRKIRARQMPPIGM